MSGILKRREITLRNIKSALNVQRVLGAKYMKKEYDFSKGERGKFYKPDLELYLPIYLEQDTMETLLKFSEEKGVEVETIIKDWINKDISIVKTVLSK